MTKANCNCPCRHRFRFLRMAANSIYDIVNEGSIQTIDELVPIYEKGCYESPRRWNGLVECILENMTYSYIIQEMNRLVSCNCCNRHKNKD